MKPALFQCPHCAQYIEADMARSGRDLACPLCGKSFTVPTSKRQKHVALLIIISILVGSAFFGLYRISSNMRHMDDPERELYPTKFEDHWQTLARFRREAEPAMLKECTNYLGFTRMIDHSINTYDDQVSNWTGNATIDFLNSVGGMQRTNLFFLFFGKERCLVMEDSVKMMDQWASAYKAEYARTHPN